MAPHDNDDWTVYVIDDDLAVRNSLGAVIRSFGFTVEVFASAAEFLTAWKPSHSGCAVIDVRMPGMSGIELQEWLAEQEAPLAIIMITGHGDSPLATRTAELGAVEYLEKPCPPRKLAAAIHKARRHLDSHHKQ